MTFGYFHLKKKKERKNGRGSNFKIIEKKLWYFERLP